MVSAAGISDGSIRAMAACSGNTANGSRVCTAPSIRPVRLYSSGSGWSVIPKASSAAFNGPRRCSRITVAKARTNRLVQNGTSTIAVSQRRSRGPPCAMACATGKPSSRQTGVSTAAISTVFPTTRRYTGRSQSSMKFCKPGRGSVKAPQQQPAHRPDESREQQQERGRQQPGTPVHPHAARAG